MEMDHTSIKNRGNGAIWPSQSRDEEAWLTAALWFHCFLRSVSLQWVRRTEGLNWSDAMQCNAESGLCWPTSRASTIVHQMSVTSSG
jgi:hypothetical protein